MKLEITTEEILELASKSEVLGMLLMDKYPDVFKNENMSDDKGRKDLPRIIRGCYVIQGTPERYTITRSNFPNCPNDAIKIFRGDSKMKAEQFVIKNTKRFTLNDIETALNHCYLSDHYGLFVSKLNDINHPDTVIHYNEDNL